MLVYHGTCLCLDRNPSLPFDIELVQDLLVATRRNCASELKESVTEGAFAMIDVSDNAEIAKALKGYLGDSFFEGCDSSGCWRCESVRRTK